MTDFSKPYEIQRLRNAVSSCVIASQVWSQNRLAALREYVGSHYVGMGKGSVDKVPINLLEMALTIYLQNLVSAMPQVLITTENPQYRPAAHLLELAVSKVIKGMNLRKTLARAVKEAFFSWGIVKTGLMGAGTVTVNGVELPKTSPFSDIVSPDDFVFDAAARSLEKAAFMGDRVVMPYEVAQQTPTFDQAVIRQLAPKTRAELLGAGGLLGGQGQDGRAENLSRQEAQFQDYDRYIEFYEIYLPRERQIVCVPLNGLDKPLRVAEYNGPAKGPYDVLTFDEIPDQILPRPQVGLWMDLHELTNRLFRKVARQAERHKTVMGVRPAGVQDGERALGAIDGDFITMDDPRNINAVSLGGVDQPTMALYIHGLDVFNRMAGNLDVLGGLAPASGTVGQDQLLAAQSSKRIAALASAVHEWTRSILEKISHYTWNDPVANIPVTLRVPGTSIAVQETWGPHQRAGSFEQYDLDIVPYSMQDQTPSMRADTIQSLVERVVLPLAPMMQQQGTTVDVDALLRTLAKYRHVEDEFSEIIRFGTPSPAEVAGAAESMPKPPVTRRVYERVGRPGPTRAGRDATTMQALLNAGGGANTSQSGGGE